MARVAESQLVGASLAETWDLYFDPGSWPAWVDGFGAVESSEGYPEPGSALVWTSTPAGRGTVRERVLEHEPRRRHRIEFTDPSSEGELLTSFEIEGEGTRVALELSYRLARGGPFVWLTERLFVRSQVRRSLQRSLQRLRHEVEAAAAPVEPPSPSA